MVSLHSTYRSISTVRWGYHISNAIGLLRIFITAEGYNQYHGGCSVLQRNTIRTMEDIQNCGGCSELWNDTISTYSGEYSVLWWDTINTVEENHQNSTSLIIQMLIIDTSIIGTPKVLLH